jgi:hypothetical protein
MASNISQAINKLNLLPAYNNNPIDFSSALNDSAIKGLKIFVSNVNSLIGHSLFEELRNDHIAIHTGETPHKFFGTINQAEAATVPVPSSYIKVLNSKTKPRTFKKQLTQCDVVLLDLIS